MTTQTEISPAMRRFILFVDHLVVFIAQHWLLLVTLFLLGFAGLPFLAPVLMHYGYTGPAELIYRVYSLTCHQLAHRSFFLFGAQPAYTLDQLHAALPGTQDEGILSFYWRDFLGNAQLGYKVAWCERDTAMYVSLIIAGLLFGLVRTRLKALDWRIYLLLLVPMALDGGTQLIGLRESDYILRTITGTLFGMGSVWLVYPYLEEAMRDLQTQAQAQWQQAMAREAAARNAALAQGK